MVQQHHSRPNSVGFEWIVFVYHCSSPLNRCVLLIKVTRAFILSAFFIISIRLRCHLPILATNSRLELDSRIRSGWPFLVLSCLPALCSLHLSEPVFLILFRYLLNGMCPVRICIIKLACFRVCLNKSLRNLWNGKLGSIWENLVLLGDVVQVVCHFSSGDLWKSCFMVDALAGSWFRSMWGRSALLLVRPPAASLDDLSAFSFPLTSLWLKTYLTVRWQWRSLGAVLRASTGYCPDVKFLRERA